MMNYNNIYSLKSLNEITSIIFFSLLFQSCSISEINPSPQLSSKEFTLIEKWVKNDVASCSFLFSHKGVADIESKIMHCIEDFDTHYRGNSHIPKQLQEKIYPQRIDYYLTSKLSSYLSKNKLSTLQLTTLLSFISGPPFGENANLINFLINKGANTKNIMIQNNLSTNGDTCKSSLVILRSNKNLYQDKTMLNEPVPQINMSLSEEGYEKNVLGKLYRKNVMFSLVVDPAYVHCRSPIFLPKLISTLISINPNLRDTIETKTGKTPLHYYLEYFQTRGLLDPVALGKQLIDINNINKKDNEGLTPLHTLLLRQSLNQSAEYTLMVKALIDAGANIDLKDKKGRTARELILEHPRLKTEASKGSDSIDCIKIGAIE